MSFHQLCHHCLVNRSQAVPRRSDGQLDHGRQNELDRWPYYLDRAPTRLTENLRKLMVTRIAATANESERITRQTRQR
jgi:hypothetical protein